MAARLLIWPFPSRARRRDRNGFNAFNYYFRQFAPLLRRGRGKWAPLTHSLAPSRTELELAVDTKFKLFPQKTRSTPGGKHATD